MTRSRIAAVLTALLIAAGLSVAVAGPAAANDCLRTDRIDAYPYAANPYIAWRVARTCNATTAGWVDLNRGGDSGCFVVSSTVGSITTIRYNPSWIASPGSAVSKYCHQATTSPFGWTVKTQSVIPALAGGGGGGGSWLAPGGVRLDK